MANLKASYLGLELKNPLVVSSNPLTDSVASVARLEAAGAAAVVMRSIFEEQINADVAEMVESLEGDTSMAALEYLRADLPGQLGPEKYVEKLKAMRVAVKIPIIASINCVKAANWVSYAKKLERAGADAIELNLYHMPVDPDETAASVETRRLMLVKAILSEVKLPVTVKLSSHYTSLLSFARMLDAAGVRGMVLFNRFLQTRVNAETESIFYAPDYSSPNVLHSQLRWTAVIRDWVRCSVAISGGIHSGEDLAKALLVGADIGYICSVLHVRRDLKVIQEILDGLSSWMAHKGYAALPAFRGKLRETDLRDGTGFERMQYVKTAAKVS
ncbi:MAG: dihydroorotate dehydrogenase-like protein [Kiritimatiellia bacterium]|jgi:dihydroorotate dehydrogenase (fumarate)|nr:dihydroorotate dehydrogenase-like protein [Kiritimatiellia bacterium]MDD4172952.1 dihydroorotate dehydrogenase-like protein [Kiritimatiellia bacterium]MDD4441365.1 dihydroorotate dehydrogenase-like protein [Kiritimatiellia bacterium]MDX9791948.1 dihydroorotate dehydrogenase-like protein [Kiritimatiellia bacterium]NLC82462.1 dihydroorotate dehydrogenase-like protein [Lentisphaerota bacterium]